MSGEKTREIKAVYVFENEMVAVFDTNGQQWAELQGKWSEKRKEVYQQLANQSYDAEFWMAGQK